MKPQAMLVCGLAALSAALSACRDATAPAQAQPGTVMASLTTPSQDDGAVLVILTGPEFFDVKPANSGYQVYWRLASAHEARVMIIGNLVPGPLFTVAVSDTRNLGAIQALLSDAASRADSSRTALGGYTITVTGAGTP